MDPIKLPDPEGVQGLIFTQYVRTSQQPCPNCGGGRLVHPHQTNGCNVCCGNGCLQRWSVHASLAVIPQEGEGRVYPAFPPGGPEGAPVPIASVQGAIGLAMRVAKEPGAQVELRRLLSYDAGPVDFVEHHVLIIQEFVRHDREDKRVWIVPPPKPADSNIVMIDPYVRRIKAYAIPYSDKNPLDHKEDGQP